MQRRKHGNLSEMEESRGETKGGDEQTTSGPGRGRARSASSRPVSLDESGHHNGRKDVQAFCKDDAASEERKRQFRQVSSVGRRGPCGPIREAAKKGGRKGRRTYLPERQNSPERSRRGVADERGERGEEEGMISSLRCMLEPKTTREETNSFHKAPQLR